MNIGDCKRLIERTRNYFSYVSLYMVGYLYIEKTGWQWWYLLIIPAVVLVAYVDANYIHRRESKSVAEKNPYLMDIWKEVCKKK